MNNVDKFILGLKRSIEENPMDNRGRNAYLHATILGCMQQLGVNITQVVVNDPLSVQSFLLENFNNALQRNVNADDNKMFKPSLKYIEYINKEDMSDDLCQLLIENKEYINGDSISTNINDDYSNAIRLSMLTGSIEIFGISGLTGIGSYNEKKIVNNIRKLYSMAEEKIQNSMQSFIKDLLINNPDDLQLVFEVTKLTQHSDQKISRSFSQLIPIIEDCDPEKVRTILSDISQGTKNDQQEQSRMIL